MAGERRQVTVLFSDLSGYVQLSERVDPERVRALIGSIKSRAIEIVESLGGIVNQFIGDEVVGLFGTPTAHEDDPVRGVRAAMALHAMVRELSTEVEDLIGQPLRLHTGVNTGLIVTHAGDTRAGRIDITGNAVNIASRLKVLAGHDDIVVGPATQSLIADYFGTEALEPVVLKGFAQPIHPYRVIGVSDVQSRFEASARKGLTHHTGRAEELATLQSRLEQARRGRGQLVALTGDPGMGKSRMMYEFRAALSRDAVTVLEGRCQPYGAATPYLPFLDALRQGWHLHEEDRVEVLRDKVVRGIEALDPGLRRYLPYYLHLLAIPDGEHPLPEASLDVERREVIEKALAEGLIAAARQRPVVLILEDWHWSDEASRSALGRLMEGLPRQALLVVLVYRSSEFQLEPRAGEPVTHLHLSPLTREQTGGMLASMLAAQEVPPALLEAIHERSAGNPLFTEELCRALRDDGTLVVEDTVVRLTRALEQVSLPRSVEGVIRSRLDRIDPQALATLRVASVIGRFFGRALLQRLVPANTPLARCVRELTNHELIQEVQQTSDLAYRFRHVLTQLVVYETLLHTQRQELHERVGQAIAETHTERIEEHLETLAFHFEHSNNARLAATYHTLAARKAARNYSFAVACEYYRMAFKRLGQCERSAEQDADAVQIALHWANAAQGEPAPELLDALQVSMERVRTLGDPKLQERVMRHTGWCHLILGHFRDARELLEESLRRSAGADGGHAHTQARNWLGRAYWAAGQYVPAVRYLREGLAQLERVEHPVESSLSHAYLAMALGGLGSFEEAWGHAERALNLGQRVGNKGCETFAQVSVAVLHSLVGNWSEAQRLVRGNLKPLLTVGYSLPIATARFCLGDVAFHTNRQAEGIALMGEAIATAEGKGTTYMDRYHGYVAYCAARMGDGQQAQRSLERHAAAELGPSHSAVCAGWAQGLLAAQGKHADLGAAERHMAGAIALATELELWPDVARGQFHFAELLVQAGRPEAAAAQLALAIPRFSTLGMAWWHSQAQALQTRLKPSAPPRRAPRRLPRQPAPRG